MEGGTMTHVDEQPNTEKRRVLVKFKIGIHRDIAMKYLSGLHALSIEDGEKSGTYVLTVETEHDAVLLARRCASSPMVSYATLG